MPLTEHSCLVCPSEIIEFIAARTGVPVSITFTQDESTSWQASWHVSSADTQTWAHTLNYALLHFLGARHD